MALAPHGLPPPARLPCTFSAADRPCRSRSEAAMTGTPGRTRQGPDEPEVAPGLTSPRRAHHRRGPAPRAEGANHREARGRGRGRDRRGHPSGLRSAAQAPPPDGAANHRRGGAVPARASPGALRRPGPPRAPFPGARPSGGAGALALTRRRLSGGRAHLQRRVGRSPRARGGQWTPLLVAGAAATSGRAWAR